MVKFLKNLIWSWSWSCIIYRKPALSVSLTLRTGTRGIPNFVRNHGPILISGLVVDLSWTFTFGPTPAAPQGMALAQLSTLLSWPFGLGGVVGCSRCCLLVMLVLSIVVFSCFPCAEWRRWILILGESFWVLNFLLFGLADDSFS